MIVFGLFFAGLALGFVLRSLAEWHEDRQAAKRRCEIVTRKTGLFQSETTCTLYGQPHDCALESKLAADAVLSQMKRVPRPKCVPNRTWAGVQVPEFSPSLEDPLR